MVYIAEIKLGLQYTLENLEVNKVYFPKLLGILCTHEELKPWSTLTYRPRRHRYIRRSEDVQNVF